MKHQTGKLRLSSKLFFTACLLLSACICRAEVIVYPAPQCGIVSKAYLLKIKEAGSNWQTVDVYHASVAGTAGLKTVIKQTSFAYFDCSGRVEVALTIPRGNIKQVKIRPLAYGITPKVNGNTILFSLNASQNVSVEINGNIFENLQVFANTIQTDKPLSTDTNVL